MLTYPLKVLRKLGNIIEPESSNFGRNWKMFPNKEYASALIQSEIEGNRPSMIARLGSTELWCMSSYLGVKHPEKYKSYKKYILNQTPAWWWDNYAIERIQTQSGFFPGTIAKLEQFCEMMIDELPNVDILGSWRKEEIFFENQLTNCKRVMLEDLEPFFTAHPWTHALKGKKVLVIHPFEETIKKQYLKKDLLFDNGLLPDFELLTIKAVQTVAFEKAAFKDWFEALDSMKNKIASVDFDVCILGCGAYGFPLASFVKKIGKKAIHMGGVTQMLFGIKGKRWENYIVYPYKNLYNQYWTRPAESETPKRAKVLEGAAYW